MIENSIKLKANGGFMKTKMMTLITAALMLVQTSVFAHGGDPNVKLHVNPKWDQCSFQLDPSLTQKQWHQFTQEATYVIDYRPLTDARPLGAMNFEVSLLRWNTKVNEEKGAWNNTFVHPDSTHWLTNGEPLIIPGLSIRAGLTDKIDVGFYLTKSIGANYGFWGAQLQYNLLNDLNNNWSASARINFLSMYGPKDLDFNLIGLDLLASRKFDLVKWTSVSPYAGVSTFLSNAYEKSKVVDLKDEHTVGLQGQIGAVAQISMARIGVEYSVAKVSSFSIKLGVAF